MKRLAAPDIVFFDMDHTVISIDCDVSWKYFLSDEGLVPAPDRSKADHFLDLYHKGLTNIDQFIEFQLKEFVGRTQEEMRRLAKSHFDTRVNDKVYPEAIQEINGYLAHGARVALLTGTNRIIAEPIAHYLNVTDLLATELEVKNDRYTGKIIEPFLMQEGKVKMAESYCQSHHSSLINTAFYADSITDLPLLEKVSQAVIVNPRNKDLVDLAKSRQWLVKNWRL
jgi:HAD superfamily hydrolase (TIGR01490 family)